MHEEIKKWLADIGFDGTRSVALYPDDVERLWDILRRYHPEMLECPEHKDTGLAVTGDDNGSTLRDCCCRK